LPFGAGKSAEVASGWELFSAPLLEPELPHAARSNDRASRPSGTAIRRVVMAAKGREGGSTLE
jgi:hypothetical protein